MSKGPINNIPSLVQIMVWRHPGAKPLSESMVWSLLTHICVTRPLYASHHFSWYQALSTLNRHNKSAMLPYFPWQLPYLIHSAITHIILFIWKSRQKYHITIMKLHHSNSMIKRWIYFQHCQSVEKLHMTEDRYILIHSPIFSMTAIMLEYIGMLPLASYLKSLMWFQKRTH